MPYDFGAPKAGTPKADEWRTLITIYIPLALISLWGDGMAHKSKNIDVQLRQALHHTMALVQAVYITPSSGQLHTALLSVPEYPN